MYKQILVATDGSELAQRALDHALALAKATGAEVTVVHISEPLAVYGAGYASVAGTVFDPVPELIEAQKSAANNVIEAARRRAEEAGVPAKTLHLDNTYAAEGIVETAGKVGADLIVMGSHGRRGLSRMLLGSQTSNVLTHTKIPVLVTR